ncbi:DsrE family protein [Arthrobacter sp. SDTb3-6]|uniref:DsrE family protein n=1 Tax=Arthrobacter sp. SDTb3-6 TaxID=2713571 RepID=UPI00159DDFB4|nr:DsrE family protein [Arthrobacter sp. SDTb3-6]NVM98050.1 hypothetical protein [Arthrobacter sp. SDTb3-6]
MVERNDAPRGLLMHGFGVGAENVAGVFRSALNAAAGLPGADIEIVIQGPAVAALVSGGALAGPVGEALQRGIAVRACENSMRSATVDAAGLAPGILPVPSAVVHLAQRQWEGWAYIRL